MKRSIQRGFTIMEVMVALAVITLISVLILGALAPWMGLKQTIDTERKLQDLRQGFTAYYDSNAMAIESLAAGRFGALTDPFITSTQEGVGSCAAQETAFEGVSLKFSESPQQLIRDGFANPWCFFVSGNLSEVRDGVTVWYRNIGVVSTGRDGVLSPTTKMDSNGQLVTGDDDIGMLVSGFDVQWPKLKDTVRRLERVGKMYETYFSTRFLANPTRDITIYYFSNRYDLGGSVTPTGNAWAPVETSLRNIGVAALDTVTPWEVNNQIELNNGNGSVGGITARGPESTGTGQLPYTALLRARVPAPMGQTQYVTQVVVGNY